MGYFGIFWGKMSFYPKYLFAIPTPFQKFSFLHSTKGLKRVKELSEYLPTSWLHLFSATDNYF